MMLADGAVGTSLTNALDSPSTSSRTRRSSRWTRVTGVSLFASG